LNGICPPDSLPEFLFEDMAYHLFAMSAIPAPHENWKTMLLRGDLQPKHVSQFAMLLATIHEQTQGAEFAEAFATTAYFESLRLEPYYLFAATRVPEVGPFLHRLVDETRQERLCLVHGDYSPKNILIHHDQLILLDHEVIHFGDPTFDLGFGLTHLLSKAHHVTSRRADFLEAAHLFWKVYGEQAALSHQPEFEARAVRQTLGCLLARVDGRSPLEYLTHTERTRQRTAAVELMHSPPDTLPALFASWGAHLRGD
jgi:thiamine kinase-like enzyme